MFIDGSSATERKFSQAAQEFFRATQIKPDSTEAFRELAGVLVPVENNGPSVEVSRFLGMQGSHAVEGRIATDGVEETCIATYFTLDVAVSCYR